MREKLKFFYSEKLSVFLFVVFAISNLYFFSKNFFTVFLNKGSNGDEYYDNNLYSFSTFSIDKLFYTPSQPYIFISSIISEMLNSPIMAVRSVSILSCLFLLLYFIKRIKNNIVAENDSLLETTYKISFFVCAIFITNQIFIGTSDFLSVVLLVLVFYYVLNSIKFGKIELKIKKSVFVGILLAFAIATRPTVMVLIICFIFSLLVILGLKNTFCNQNFIIAITAFLTFFLINFLPLIEENKVILDIKEVPVTTGVNWFQRNYLMAKFWDANILPTTKWVSVQDVIDFKKQNPNFVFPKNQLELLITEPSLFSRQLVRMFIKGTYTSYRFMYMFFPLLFLTFLKTNRYWNLLSLKNEELEQFNSQNKIIIITHFTSIIFFSFLAVKMLEFRWLIPSLIIFMFYSINFLSLFTKKVRFLVYNISFFSGIVMYLWFFMKEGF
jgi:hypothetical protein